MDFEYNISLDPTYNNYGALLYFDNFKQVSFESCTFRHNIGSFAGAILFKIYNSNWESYDSSLLHISIKNCTFESNGSTHGGGAVVITGTQEPGISGTQDASASTLLNILIEGNTF